MYHLLLPEFIIVVFALMVPALAYVIKVKRHYLGYFTLIGLIIALFLVLDQMGLGVINALGFNAYTYPIGQDPASSALALAVKLKIDLFALFFHLIFLSVAILVVITSVSYVKKDEPHQGEYYSLLLLATLGMMILAAADDLFVLFLGLELTSLSTFALVAFRKRDKKSSEAALKFFIIGAASSALILFGISLLYGAATQSLIKLNMDTGNVLNLSNLGEAISLGISNFEPTMILGIVFLIAGFGFKVAVVPFHMWAPDVYEGAPTPITAFLAAGSKKMGLVAFFKIFLVALIAAKGDWVLVMGILAVVTMTVGNVMAIPQKNIKRMLAYSSIAQAGYILIALVVAGGTYVPGAGTAANYTAHYAITGGAYHILTHAFMKVGAFIAVALVFVLLKTEDIEGYKGLYKKYPLIALCMTIFLLSLVGLPPFGGFFSKWVLFSSAIQAKGWFVWLAVAGVLNSALSLYYYVRVIRYMYIESEEKPIEKMKAPRGLTVAMVIAAVFVILTFLLVQIIISTGMTGAGSLLP
jgi:proton-translocating NADH-quinone oxidoreductase chain N